MLKKIIIGLTAGIISGLFSTGGGMILVPAFIYFLGFSEKEARATSIMCVLAMAITTSFFYAKNNYINFLLAIECVIGGIVGGFIGSKLLNKLNQKILKIIFIVFIIYIGIKFIQS